VAGRGGGLLKSLGKTLNSAGQLQLQPNTFDRAAMNKRVIPYSGRKGVKKAMVLQLVEWNWKMKDFT
jgi:hypothetical protein